jgi:peptidoglycan LD-endopeptidase LytH
MTTFSKLATGAFVLSIIIFSVPYNVDAQSRGRVNREQWERWRDQWEESQEGVYTDEDTERVTSRRGVSSGTQKKIDALSDNAVDNLPIPILFGVTLSQLFPNFGDPRDGGDRTHEGLDIMAPEETPIVSPTDAVVMRTGTGSSAGKYVYTANPGGETFAYMHLTRIADIDSGDALEAGDVIGYVGNTGNASGGPAHLHFEIRDGKEPTDPFPRLTKTFALKDKISFLDTIFKDVSDDEEYAEFLVTNFRTEFINARAQGITLPEDIEDALGSTAGSVVTAAAGDDLTVGSSGTKVTALQNFLITFNVGSAAKALADAGATGYFGAVTQKALIEYQKEMGIKPADGFYGPTTRAKILVTEVASAPNDTVAVPVPAGAMPTADIGIGAQGAGVTCIQNFLIRKNVGIAAGKLKDAGATGYFGAVTREALMEYQAANNITPATGYYGPLTRAQIAAVEQAGN